MNVDWLAPKTARPELFAPRSKVLEASPSFHSAVLFKSLSFYRLMIAHVQPVDLETGFHYKYLIS